MLGASFLLGGIFQLINLLCSLRKARTGSMCRISAWRVARLPRTGRNLALFGERCSWYSCPSSYPRLPFHRLGIASRGVTETLIRFEKQKLIRKARGVLQLDERKGLEEKTCSSYRLISSAYASLDPAPIKEPAS